MKRFWVECFVVFLFLTAYGQSAMVSLERAESLSSMADFYFTAGNYDKAIDYQEQALDMIGILSGKNSFDYASLSLTLANYYYSKGRNYLSNSDVSAKRCYSNAIESLMKAIGVINDSLLVDYDRMDSKDKTNLWQQVCPLYDRLLPCYVSFCQNDTTLSTLYNSVLFSKGITWRDYKKAKEGDWKFIQKKLHTDDLAIEFISPVNLEEDNISFYALVLDNKCNAPRMIRLFDILQLQDSLKCATSKFDKNLKIGKLIWKPLEKDLQGIKNVYFSATHVLHNIPIEFCPMNDSSYYADKYNIYRLSSTMELVYDIMKPQYDNAVLYGGLEYDYENKTITSNDRAGLEFLNNTGVEVSAICRLLQNAGVKCVAYTGSSGTESSFRHLTGKDIKILHVSTHGKYELYSDTSKFVIEEDALSHSYLVFSGANQRLIDSSIKDENDGIVTALDISRMKLSTLDLVCLSACESALGVYGDDDGIIGLQKGFKMAGANTILMSVDKVDDEAIKILMVEFYKNLMNGKSKQQSLKDAQIHLRQVDNGKYDKPEYWASAYSGDSRSPIPMISVHSVGDLLYRRQS